MCQAWCLPEEHCLWAWASGPPLHHWSYSMPVGTRGVVPKASKSWQLPSGWHRFCPEGAKGLGLGQQQQTCRDRKFQCLVLCGWPGSREGPAPGWSLHPGHGGTLLPPDRISHSLPQESKGGHCPGAAGSVSSSWVLHTSRGTVVGQHESHLRDSLGAWAGGRSCLALL